MANRPAGSTGYPPAALPGPPLAHAEGRRPSRSALVSPRNPTASPLTDWGPTEPVPPVVLQPALAPWPARASSFAKLPVPAVPAARERSPELVGRGPGLNQPGQAAATVNLGLGDPVGPCVSTVRGESTSRAAIAVLVNPSATNCRTSISRLVTPRPRSRAGREGSPVRNATSGASSTRRRAKRAERCQHSGRSIGAGHAERVWLRRRLDVVARAERVPPHGRC